MKIGIIGSAGGSAFSELYSLIREQQVDGSENHQFYIVTDRECGLESICSNNNLPYRRIVQKDNRLFSKYAKEYFDSVGGVEFVLLFFSRLVTSDLYSNYNTLNIHPALLPSFKGMSPIKQFIKGKARFLGSTLHLVDESIDGGPIIAQVSMPIKDNTPEEKLNKFSFIQKTYLAAVAVELFENRSITINSNKSNFILNGDLPCNDRCNPSLTNRYYYNGIRNLQMVENVEVII